MTSLSGHALDLDQFEDIKVIRFIRDPRDLIISGYFYHKRGGEDWCDYKNPTTVDYTLSLYGIFTEPQIAAVGMSEKEARVANINYKTADYPFNDHGKSMVHGSEHGFVKLIVAEETRKIIGASVIGPEAVELIHEIVVAMSFGATAKQLLEIPHYHPTLSEIWTYPAEELAT
jgi:pyruvate/2-oxoglutarate dehydrogenase complex dihydrolipoamide dehydrogenase (E3) component